MLCLGWYWGGGLTSPQAPVPCLLMSERLFPKSAAVRWYRGLYLLVTSG